MVAGRMGRYKRSLSTTQRARALGCSAQPARNVIRAPSCPDGALCAQSVGGASVHGNWWQVEKRRRKGVNSLAEIRTLFQEFERPREAVVTDQELKEEIQDGVEIIDLNSQRDVVKPTTWHLR